MGKRSYGPGRLFARVDSGGRETWYGSWWAGEVRVKRRIGPKRRPGTADGLTRTQAERELRHLIETEVVLHGAQRRTVEQAGAAYAEHLEHVMERKRTTLQDYRGYLRRHLVPFFGERTLDKIDAERVRRYLIAKRAEGLSSETAQNHLNFLSGLFAFSVRRGWTTSNPVALVDRPKAPRAAHRRVRFLQPAELEAVIRAVPEDHLGAIERPLYLMAAMTGLRQGELIGLRWSDVDWVAARVRVAESYTRGGVRLTEVRARAVGADGRAADRRDRAALSAITPPARPRPRLRPPGDRQRAGCLQAAQALPRSGRARRRRRPHLPRAAPHVRHADGGGRRAAARDPGMDGPR